MLNLDILPSEVLRVCLVCVICNSNSNHSVIFKICIMNAHTLNMCTFYFVNLFHFFLVLVGEPEIQKLEKSGQKVAEF